MKNYWFGLASGVVMAVSVMLPGPWAGAEAAVTRPVARANLLGVPLHTGKVQLSCPFLQINAAITEVSKERVVFTSNYKNVSIAVDPNRPGGVNLVYGQDKMKGSIEKGQNSSVLALDNVGRFTLTQVDERTLIISGVLPFNLKLTYVD